MNRLLLLLFVASPCCANAQKITPDPRAMTRSRMDSLIRKVDTVQNDTNKLKMLVNITRGFLQLGNPDSQLIYAKKAMAQAIKVKDLTRRADAYWLMIWAYRTNGKYPQALQTTFEILQFAEKEKDAGLIWQALRQLCFTYLDMEEYAQSLAYARRNRQLVQSGAFNTEPKENQLHRAFAGYMNFMGSAFSKLHQWDSALYFRRMAYGAALQLREHQDLALAAEGLGNIFYHTGMYDSAIYYHHQCLMQVAWAGFRQDLAADAQLDLARIYQQRQQLDSASHYARRSYAISANMQRLAKSAEAAQLLHQLYEHKAPKDSAYKYLLIATALHDSLYDQEKIKEVESIKYKEALRRRQQEAQRKEAAIRYDNQIKLYTILGSVLLLLSVVFFMYRLRQIKKEANLKSGFLKKLNEVEMKALRAQMNPHFIFNCLNSINLYIVKKDPVTASGYLTKFARLIRLILDNSAADAISLEKEIETLRLYIEMERLRFDGAFEYSIEVEENIIPDSLFIPAMLMQPYVENAIWHGLLHKAESSGNLWIRFRKPVPHLLIAEVEDNGVGRLKAKAFKSKENIKNKSYGMQITKDRIMLFNEQHNTAAAVEVADANEQPSGYTGTKVTVKIPVKYQ